MNFEIKLNADISIWMQSSFDGFDSSASLVGGDITGLHKWGGAHQTFLKTQLT